MSQFPNHKVDIQEDYILSLSRDLLATMLCDRTTGKNIFWATDNYSHFGAGYQYYDPITIDSITGHNGSIIVPRAVKSKAEQLRRARQMAEVFTPSWICNRMNNQVDEIWFGRKGTFNTEVDPSDGSHTWEVNPAPVSFPPGKVWQDYVKDIRLEITCGEAPFLVSRYDTVTGEPIPIERRIGLLDRKLRVVSENSDSMDAWREGSRRAFKSIYGYEWQGDNLLLAREALLFTFIDYFQQKFGIEPDIQQILEIAHIISWNIWQMDGLKFVIPNSCMTAAEAVPQMGSIFGDEPPGSGTVKKQECPACKAKKFKGHIGIQCKIMDWEAGTPIFFSSLLKSDK